MIRSAWRFFSQQRAVTICLVFLAAAFLYGCGGRPVAPIYKPVPETRSPEPAVPEVNVPEVIQPEVPVLIPSPAGDRHFGPATPLYQKAKNFMGERDYRQAELAMERALRIEPKNGYYWYTLAEIKYAEKEYGKTIQLCLKSKSLAGTDTQLIQLNEQLMAKSK